MSETTHLVFDLTTSTLAFQQKSLLLKAGWADLLMLCAIKANTNYAFVSPAEARQLSSLSVYSSDASFHAALSREHKHWSKYFGFAILAGQLGKLFQIDPTIRFEVVQPLNEIQAHLGQLNIQLTDTPGQLQQQDQTRAEMMLGKLLFEYGKLELAFGHFTQAMNTKTHYLIKFEALFYQARCLELLGDYQTASIQLEKLLRCIQWREQHNHPMPTEAKAWYLVGMGRLALRQQSYQTAHEHFLTAKKQLGSMQHRELGMVESGLRAVAYHQQRLSDAQQHAQSALSYFYKANWGWAVQAALNDCGTVYRRRAELIWENQPNQAKQHVLQALNYFLQCHEHCQVAGFGDHSAAVETNLGWCYRKLEQWRTAKDWLEKALTIASTANNHNDHAWALCEYGELELLQDQPLKAANKFHEAFNLFDKIGLYQAREYTRQRLEQTLMLC